MSDAPLLDCSHPVIFDCLDKHVIRSTVIHVDGAAGASGLDAIHSDVCVHTSTMPPGFKKT